MAFGHETRHRSRILDIHVSGHDSFGHFRVYSAVAAINSKSEFPVSNSEEWLVKMLEFQVSLLVISTMNSIVSKACIHVIQCVASTPHERLLALRYHVLRKFKFGERM